MRIFFIALGFLWCLACPPAVAEAANPASGVPGTIVIGVGEITYYAQSGDTLSSIALNHTTRSGNWIALGKLNRISKDISIPIGTGITIPANLLPDEPNEGRIIAFSGRIRASAANGAEVPIALGSIIREGTQLETGGNSFLTLSLADQSRVSIPSNSRIRLSKLRMARYTKSPRTEVTLLQGRVESRVAPLNINKGVFEVQSPQSVTGVRGTHFRVALSESHVANEVLSGSVEVGRPGAPAALVLGNGQGNLVTSQNIGRAVELLPAPQLAAAAPAAEGGALRFDLQRVAGAGAYQIQIATDSDAQNILTEGRAADGRIRIQGLRDGSYFVRMSAIDAAGLEGISRIRPFTAPPERQAASEAPAPLAAPGAPATLSWPASATAQAYRLRIARDPAFRAIVDEVELARPHYVNATLEPGQYYWQVAAVSVRGGMRAQEPFGRGRPLTVAPAQGAPFVDGSDRDRLWLRWQAAPGQKFQVQVARDPAFTWMLLSSSTDVPEIRLTRPAFGTYYARVQTINPDGSANPFSLAQAFVVTDHWIIHDGEPFSVRESLLRGAR
jgi:hypothetical protein